MTVAALPPDAGDAVDAGPNDRGAGKGGRQHATHEIGGASRRLRSTRNESRAGSKEFYLAWKEFCLESNEFDSVVNEFDSVVNEFGSVVNEFYFLGNEFDLGLNEFYFKSNEFRPARNEFHPTLKESCFEWNEFYLAPNEFDSACAEFRSASRSLGREPRRRTIDVRHRPGGKGGPSMAARPAARGDAGHLRPRRAGDVGAPAGRDVAGRAAARHGFTA